MRNKLLLAGGIVPLVVMALTGVASAQSAFDPAEATTSMATDAVSTMGPIVLALGSAVVVLAIAAWGVRAVLRTIRSGGRSAG